LANAYSFLTYALQEILNFTIKIWLFNGFLKTELI
jgi:hypothetical protein